MTTVTWREWEKQNRKERSFSMRHSVKLCSLLVEGGCKQPNSQWLSGTSQAHALCFHSLSLSLPITLLFLLCVRLQAQQDHVVTH